MLKRFLPSLAGVAALALVGAAVAQRVEPGGPARPGPGLEHARLGFLVGEWTTQAEIKSGPWGPGAKVTGRDRCRWMEGRYFITCNTELEGASGKLTGLAVFGYDPGSRRYMRASFHSDGQAALETGAVEARTWTFSSDRRTGETTLHNRFVFVEKGAGRYDFRIELSPDGVRWDTLVEGSATKR